MAEFFALPPAGAPLPMQSSATAPSLSPEARRAAEEFEAMFLSEMLAPMFENLDTDGLGGGGMGEQMFRPMLVEHYARAIAQSGGVGLADSIVRELNRLQASQSPSGALRDPANTMPGAANGADR